MAVCFLESEDLTLALNALESELCGRLRLTPTVAECWKSVFLTPSATAMCEQPESTISNGLTSSAADSPARIFPTPASERESTESAAGFGASTRASFANYDRATSSWRTSQLCLDGELSVFSETWPKSGMTRSGKAYELPTLELPIEENESGFWPTPTANEDMVERMKRAENLDGPEQAFVAAGARRPIMADNTGERTGRLSVRPWRPFEAAADAQWSGEICNSPSKGLPDRASAQVGKQSSIEELERSDCDDDSNANGESQSGPAIPWGECNHWAVEPGVGRVAHGIPARVDRLRGLGNAIVPQIAEWIGERIIQAHVP